MKWKNLFFLAAFVAEILPYYALAEEVKEEWESLDRSIDSFSDFTVDLRGSVHLTGCNLLIL